MNCLVETVNPLSGAYTKEFHAVGLRVRIKYDAQTAKVRGIEINYDLNRKNLSVHQIEDDPITVFYLRLDLLLGSDDLVRFSRWDPVPFWAKWGELLATLPEVEFLQVKTRLECPLAPIDVACDPDTVISNSKER